MRAVPETLVRRSAPAALGSLLLALALLAWSGPATAQDSPTSLVGTVTAIESGDPIQGVEIVLVGADRAAVSDDRGRFRFEDLTPGSYTVRVRHGEAVSRRLTARLQGGTVTDLDVRIQSGPVPVEDLEVQVEGVRHPGKMAGFYRRRATRPGLFLDGDDLSRMPGGTLTDALRDQPGLGVSRCAVGGGPASERTRRSGTSFGVRPEDEENPHETGSQPFGERGRERAADEQRRREGKSPLEDAPGRERSFIPGCHELRVDRGGRDDCRPRYYLDGSALPVNDPDMLRNLGGLDASVLAGVEIYRGPSEIPARYTSQDGCGVVLLWTRSGASAGR